MVTSNYQLLSGTSILNERYRSHRITNNINLMRLMPTLPRKASVSGNQIFAKYVILKFDTIFPLTFGIESRKFHRIMDQQFPLWKALHFLFNQFLNLVSGVV
jgi:hypothetical protein